MLTEILHTRENKVKPKRGDVIKFRFIRDHNYGYYFYDGEKSNTRRV